MENNLPHVITRPDLSVDGAFEYYWRHSATYIEIQHLLVKYHDVFISIDALKKKRQKLNLRKRRGIPEHSRADIREAIEIILPTLPWTAGYRNVTDTLRQKGYDVRRDTVMELMRELDSEGIELRRRRKLVRRTYRSPGPNFCWHMDGYDKLKPFGFAIHGCIDGFSRRIMWLEVNPSNNNPQAVARYYVQCVRQLEGCPAFLTSDPGTETTVVAAMQCNFKNDLHAHRFTKSTANQRIEAWWCQMRRNRIEWWISYFNALHDDGVFNKYDQIHIYALRYAFMPVLKNELYELVQRWNNHYISNGKRANCPSGRPNILHALGEDYIVRVNGADIDTAMDRTVQQCRSGEPDFDEYASIVYNRRTWADPSTTDEAFEQFTSLLHECNE